MKYNYNEILKKLPYNMETYEEAPFVYFLPASPIDALKGTLLLEEKENSVVIWSNEIEGVNYSTFYKDMLDLIDCDLIIAYIDIEAEYEEILKIGGQVIEFTEGEYTSKLGSLVLRMVKR